MTPAPSTAESPGVALKPAGSLDVPVKPRHSHVSHRRQSDVVFRLLVVAAAVFVVLTLAGTALYLILQAWPAPNGEIIAASQGYETKASAEKGIEAIKTHAPNAKVEDHTEAKST